MPTYVNGDVEIYYEETGSGFPILLIAPGGMRSAVSFWDNVPWNPITELGDRYRIIAMDQRNAGRSTAPVTARDGWHSYIGDQLGLMDHLGVDRFHVMGMCIGGSYGMGLIEAAPDRVASAVLFQPIGLTDNRDAFYEMFDTWAADLRSERSASEADWSAFRESMYGGDAFLFNVTEATASACTTPILVLMGSDLYHPEQSSRDLVRLAPNATLIEEWKSGAAQAAGKTAVAEFLAANSG